MPTSSNDWYEAIMLNFARVCRDTIILCKVWDTGWIYNPRFFKRMTVSVRRDSWKNHYS